MGKMTFITSGKIGYKFSGKTLYESIELTACGKKFPSLSGVGKIETSLFAENIYNKSRFGSILTAPSLQCLETALIFGNKMSLDVHSEADLLPLRFELNKLLSGNEFEKFGVTKFVELRKRFIERFFENQLLDGNSEIKRRFNVLVKKYVDKNVLAVSHAYLIKLFSIYYQVGDRMYKDKSLLIRMFDPNKEPMGRLEILEITI